MWINDHTPLAEKFVNDFFQRFSSGLSHPRSLPSLGLLKLISDQENQELTKLPNLNEVQLALFNMDSNKTSGHDGFGG